MSASNWQKEKLEQLIDDIEASKELAKEFLALSHEFAAIADELDKGGANNPINATQKSNEIRAILAQRNKLVKSTKEAVKDLGELLKESGIVGTHKTDALERS